MLNDNDMLLGQLELFIVVIVVIVVYLLYLIWVHVKVRMLYKPSELIWALAYFMLLLSIYVLYSNVSYIYPVSYLVEIKLFQKIVSKHH